MAIAVIREEMSPLWLIHLTYHLEGIRGKKKKNLVLIVRQANPVLIIKPMALS